MRNIAYFDSRAVSGALLVLVAYAALGTLGVLYAARRGGPTDRLDAELGVSGAIAA